MVQIGFEGSWFEGNQSSNRSFVCRLLLSNRRFVFQGSHVAKRKVHARGQNFQMKGLTKTLCWRINVPKRKVHVGGQNSQIRKRHIGGKKCKLKDAKKGAFFLGIKGGCRRLFALCLLVLWAPLACKKGFVTQLKACVQQNLSKSKQACRQHVYPNRSRLAGSICLIQAGLQEACLSKSKQACR